MLRDEVAKAMIRRNFPSLSETDVAEMVDCWLPDADAAIAIVVADLRKRAEHYSAIDEGFHANALADVADAYSAYRNS